MAKTVKILNANYTSPATFLYYADYNYDENYPFNPVYGWTTINAYTVPAGRVAKITIAALGGGGVSNMTMSFGAYNRSPISVPATRFVSGTWNATGGIYGTMVLSDNTLIASDGNVFPRELYMGAGQSINMSTGNKVNEAGTMSFFINCSIVEEY